MACQPCDLAVDRHIIAPSLDFVLASHSKIGYLDNINRRTPKGVLESYQAKVEVSAKRIRSKVIVFLGGVTLVCVAYVLGIQAAGLLDEWELSRNTEQYRSKAVQQTAAVLRKMGTIKVGDTLSNFYFEDIDGELRQLKKIVTDRTLITYIKPDCDGCLVELERLRSAADSPEDYRRVLIISSANPLHLQKLREDYGLGCLFLYDEERLFGAALKIQTFPFNMVINRDRVILEIYASILLPYDYERLFSLTSHPERYQTSHPEPRLPRACRRVEGWLKQLT